MYAILIAIHIVFFISAWAGLEEEAAVDEEEAVRKVSGKPPGLITILRREQTKPVGDDEDKMLSVM